MVHRAKVKGELILCWIFHLIRSWEKFSIRIFKHCGTYCKQSLNENKKYPSPIFRVQTIFPINNIIISLTFNILDWQNWKKRRFRVRWSVLWVQLCCSQARSSWDSHCKMETTIHMCMTNSESSLDQIK